MGYLLMVVTLRYRPSAFLVPRREALPPGLIVDLVAAQPGREGLSPIPSLTNFSDVSTLMVSGAP